MLLGKIPGPPQDKGFLWQLQVMQHLLLSHTTNTSKLSWFSKIRQTTIKP